jgi:WD40 repeat protein
VAKTDIPRVADAVRSHLDRVGLLIRRAVATVLNKHATAVTAVAFSPEGSLLASGDRDGEAWLWDAVNGREIRYLGAKGAPVTDVSFTDTYLMIAYRHYVRPFYLRSNRYTKFPDPPDGPFDVLVPARGANPDFAGVDDDGNVLVGDVGRDYTQWSVGRLYRPCGIALSLTGRLAAIDDGRVISVWDLSHDEQRAEREVHIPGSLEGDARRAAFRPDGEILAVTYSDGNVRLWDAETGRLVQILATDGRVPAGAAVFSADGAVLAVAGDDHVVREWDVPSGTLRRVMEGHTGPITKLAYSPTEHLLASASEDGTVRLWR